MTREEWKLVEEYLQNDKVRHAMAGRCEEQGHDFENCCSAMFQLYQACKWCGATR